MKRFMGSGILELYVLGDTTPDETREVERMRASHQEVRDEIDAIARALEAYGQANAIAPDPTIRPFLMATIDYAERLKAGEQPGFPPLLHPGSTIADYAQWLDRPDLQLREPLEDAHALFIGQAPGVQTAIVWLKYGSPPETHTNELESFLVIEGTCDITVGAQVHHMRPGGVLTIPLHATHHVRVTSDIPCKVILQRVAA